MSSRPWPWLALGSAAVLVLLNREVVSFAIENLPGLLGFGEFGILPERALGLEGRRLASEGRVDEAIGAFDASLAIDPRGEYRRELGLVWMQRGNFDRAEQELLRHIQSFPRDGLALLTLAVIAEGRRDPPSEVRARLLQAQSALQDELRDLEQPAVPFPTAESEKHTHVLARLRATLAQVEDLLASLPP